MRIVLFLGKPIFQVNNAYSIFSAQQFSIGVRYVYIDRIIVNFLHFERKLMLRF